MGRTPRFMWQSGSPQSARELACTARVAGRLIADGDADTRTSKCGSQGAYGPVLLVDLAARRSSSPDPLRYILGVVHREPRSLSQGQGGEISRSQSHVPHEVQ